MARHEQRERVPAPIALSTRISPPRPVPAPTPLVVKNGSKMRARLSGAMPQPVSVTVIATNRR
jgi:hypothetical protein